MKRVFVCFSIALLLLSCGSTDNNKSNHEQNVNIKISESSGGWEYLESVEAASYSGDNCPPSGAGSVLRIMHVYIRVVAGEKYIGVSMGPNANPKVVSLSPYYNTPNSSWGKYQYRVKYYDGKYYYFNI